MASRIVQEVAVGFCVDVDIEIDVHFRCAEDHAVEHVHYLPAIVGIGVETGADLPVSGVTAQGFHRLQVEALNVEECLEIPLLQHVDEVAGDPSAAEAALDLSQRPSFDE